MNYQVFSTDPAQGGICVDRHTICLYCSMKLHIKNMVCHRCKLAVASVLSDLKLQVLNLELGEVVLAGETLSQQQSLKLREKLEELGFELLDDKRAQLIEKIKSLVILQIHHAEKPSPEKLSTLISRQLHHDYSYLSKLFSEVEGVSIEQFMLQQKIERVKELIIYNELSISEIALQLGYSSTAHLSTQFKKLTGLTPTAFKNNNIRNLRALDQVS